MIKNIYITWELDNLDYYFAFGYFKVYITFYKNIKEINMVNNDFKFIWYFWNTYFKIQYYSNKGTNMQVNNLFQRYAIEKCYLKCLKK